MSQIRIFFAADEKLLSVLSEPLRKAGLVVETFRTQADVVPAAKVDPPDALLLGARLPDGTALAAFEAIGQGNQPPTVVVLAQSQLAARAGLLKSGIADIAISPIRPRQLAARLAELAGGVRRNETREYVRLSGTVTVGGRALPVTTLDVSREGIGLELEESIPAQSLITIQLE